MILLHIINSKRRVLMLLNFGWRFENYFGAWSWCSWKFSLFPSLSLIAWEGSTQFHIVQIFSLYWDDHGPEWLAYYNTRMKEFWNFPSDFGSYLVISNIFIDFLKIMKNNNFWQWFTFQGVQLLMGTNQIYNRAGILHTKAYYNYWKIYPEWIEVKLGAI